MVEAHAGHGVGVMVDQQLLDSCRHKGDAVQRLDLVSQPAHGAFCIRPARAPVDIASAAAAPLVGALEATCAADVCSGVQDLGLVGADGLDVCKRLRDVLLLGAPGGDGEPDLVVVLGGKVGAPVLHGGRGEAGVVRGGIVGADDARRVDAGAVWSGEWVAVDDGDGRVVVARIAAQGPCGGEAKGTASDDQDGRRGGRCCRRLRSHCAALPILENHIAERHGEKEGRITVDRPRIRIRQNLMPANCGSKRVGVWGPRSPGRCKIGHAASTGNPH